MRLANAAGRDNNFNLIRMLAALAVLVSHSYPLALGYGAPEPAIGPLRLSTVAVDVFFVTSGFLVTRSLLNSRSAVDFLFARVLRIFPALLVVVLLSAFGVGLYFTTLPAEDYLTHRATLVYLLRCVTLFADVALVLPGVFVGNPLPGVVNGSLWTLPVELWMYATLLGGWVSLRHLREKRVLALVGTAAALFAVLAFAMTTQPHFPRLLFLFASGAAYYVLRRHVVMSASLFCSFGAATMLAGAVGGSLFMVVYGLTIGYLLLYLAIVPTGAVRSYNRIGDYSYGVYIWAFPVQQTIAAVSPGIGVLQMALMSGTMSLLLGAASWHLLEKRALSFKGSAVQYARRAFPVTAA